VDRDKNTDSGFEINWVKMMQRPDGYESHIKLLPRASETGDQLVLGNIWARNADVGDDAETPGDPSDELLLAYAISKGMVETQWAIEVTLSNVTKGKAIGTFKKEGIVTQAEFFEAGQYYGSLAATAWGQKVEVLGWGFVGGPAPGAGRTIER
jgi:hypothetical protein